jgi:hypothetical protein
MLNCAIRGTVGLEIEIFVCCSRELKRECPAICDSAHLISLTRFILLILCKNNFLAFTVIFRIIGKKAPNPMEFF